MKPPLKILILPVLLLIAQNYLLAQEKFDINFGKVSPADFDLSAYKFDTSAGAVYISDKGVTDFGDGREGLKIIFKRQLRIKVLNKNGFDAANFSIPVYQGNYGEYKLDKLNAVTYNMEGGKVKQVKLDDNSIFTDKINKYWSRKKFTLPAVKEGSIIEVSYRIETRYKEDLFPWEFQGRYPRIWSEYQATVPGFFDYVFRKRGTHPYHINTQTEGQKTYLIINDLGTAGDQSITIRSPVITARWVMKDVPAMEEQPFVTTVDNYASSMAFQLSEIKEPYTPRKIMTTWNEFSDILLKSEDFGGAFLTENDWLKDEMKTINVEAVSPLEKTKKIYEYIRDNFTRSRYGFFTTNPLRNIFKTRNGSVGDINLLLIAMLRNQGIAADPVILSTRDHGFANEQYPLEESFNYVIASVNIAGKRIFMDATEPGLAFGKLPLSCYNGHARIVNSKSPEAVYFRADTLKESKVTSVVLGFDANGKLAGTYGSKLGYYESLGLRRQIAKEGNDKLLQSYKKEYPVGIELSTLVIDSLKNADQPVQVKYNIDGEIFNTDIVYFNPMLAEAYTDNPFKSGQRLFPVEMPYTRDETYIFSIEIPAGYVVDELPASVKIDLGRDDGFFEYRITKSLTTVNLRSRIVINRANFAPGEYEMLRNFFADIIKKHSEQIVFKKKK